MRDMLERLFLQLLILSIHPQKMGVAKILYELVKLNAIAMITTM